MGSDNCNSYYNIDQNSGPYYQNLSSQNVPSQNTSMKNEWSSEPISDANSSSQTQDSESENQIRSSSESPSKNSPAPSQHLIQMSAPPHQWNFSPSIAPSSYQRFYGDSHYILTSNGSQHSSLHSTPSSSIHSLNSEVQNPHQTIHHMQTNQQHLKKNYYQGLKKSFHNRFIELPVDWKSEIDSLIHLQDFPFQIRFKIIRDKNLHFTVKLNTFTISNLLQKRFAFDFIVFESTTLNYWNCVFNKSVEIKYLRLLLF